MVVESIKLAKEDFSVHMLSDTKDTTSSPPTSPEETNKVMETKDVENNSILIIKDEKDEKIENIPVSDVVFDEESKIPVLSCSDDQNNPEMVPDENPTVSGAKAYYYSQLSVMLFEKAVGENPAFPEDLDRVHTWFVKDLSDAQKLVTLRELLSLISPSQHRFLFTSVSFDSEKSGGDEETVWLDLAMSETQKILKSPASKLGALEKETKGKLENRLQSLDLTPGPSLFSGLNVSSKNKLPLSAGPNHSSSTIELALASVSDRSDSPALSIDSQLSNSSVNIAPSSVASAIDLAASLAPAASLQQSASPVPSLTDSTISKFSSFLNLQNAPPVKTQPPVNPLAGKAPPGFLSPNASEFRPSEPSCYSDVYLSDFAQWLRLLRLHKYTDCLKPHHDKDKLNFLNYSETDLEQAGVCAMGARRKFLRLFERIKEEKNIKD